jgi:hypothetical protein
VLHENDVVEAVARYLEHHGYVITQRASTMQRGIDLVASSVSDPVHSIHIEAKGETSSKPWTARYGTPFDGGQGMSHIARAVLTAMRTVSLPDNASAAMALPRNELHEGVMGPIMPALRVCGIGVFWVGEDLSVSVEAPWPI